MKIIVLMFAVLSLGTGSSVGSQVALSVRAKTVSGIVLDQPWKAKLYEFSRANLGHPAWGWTHSERDYLLAEKIAKSERLAIDRDILFAASFLHDVGAIAPFAKDGVDHAEQSAALVGDILKNAGFPMEKLPAVQSAILEHMFDKPAGSTNESIVLHDADALDFMGMIGIVRRIGATGASPSIAPGMGRIETVMTQAPKSLKTHTARRMGQTRLKEMKEAMNSLKNQSLGVPF